MENNKRAEWGALSNPNGVKPGMTSPGFESKSGLVVLQPDEAMEADLNSFFPLAISPLHPVLLVRQNARIRELRHGRGV